MRCKTLPLGQEGVPVGGGSWWEYPQVDDEVSGTPSEVSVWPDGTPL